MKCVERKDEEKVVQGKDKTRCSLEKKDDDGGKNKCKERNLKYGAGKEKKNCRERKDEEKMEKEKESTSVKVEM